MIAKESAGGACAKYRYFQLYSYNRGVEDSGMEYWMCSKVCDYPALAVNRDKCGNDPEHMDQEEDERLPWMVWDDKMKDGGTGVGA
mmetsp:Transcript_590/g.811  ORF Transcript_590/g.811 Transcript_590/m.811 type:complete len:86 (-) Transcript_590:247-504(-)|eukprot:CAMPEP_0195253164 /NCGR_PEP_ID=MMETSP0706-20130129/4294_1 /TAXON_ID=33640 /ORGANISM="Asterionellopsis glacialis, Strain CCMP134" /LENGTH=85 /DNA_ID=CAMNT_0040305597 /DNA_START=245 /DNA_END=502 /DNA_ORIENTATION=-